MTSNGCGPGWCPWLAKLIPDGRYGEVCDWHDAAYEAGGSEIERWGVEWLFFRALVKRGRWWHIPLAMLYAGATLVLGWSSWRYT